MDSTKKLEAAFEQTRQRLREHKEGIRMLREEEQSSDEIRSKVRVTSYSIAVLGFNLLPTMNAAAQANQSKDQLRHQADIELRDCVKKAGALPGPLNSIVAQAMFLGVDLGGESSFQTSDDPPNGCGSSQQTFFQQMVRGALSVLPKAIQECCDRHDLRYQRTQISPKPSAEDHAPEEAKPRERGRFPSSIEEGEPQFLQETPTFEDLANSVEDHGAAVPTLPESTDYTLQPSNQTEESYSPVWQPPVQQETTEVVEPASNAQSNSEDTTPPETSDYYSVPIGDNETAGYEAPSPYDPYGSEGLRLLQEQIQESYQNSWGSYYNSNSNWNLYTPTYNSTPAPSSSYYTPAVSGSYQYTPSSSSYSSGRRSSARVTSAE